ncbi:Aldo-keto reductase IolS [Geodia barretti]|uniref:Aldo-keto reductase IolS n=1 Tax=Geodia barretti TaxID=519541 RepID=A0AA35WCN0_GEOBA|nr:Aldo-keto reductase IolS [Geodia barretti]
MGEVDERQAIAATHAAIDSGVTFIDTAEGYRTSEDVLGRALEGRRDDVFLATKLSGDHSVEHIRKALTNSLKGPSYRLRRSVPDPRPETGVAYRGHNGGTGVIAHSPLAKGLLTGKYSAGHEFPEGDERHDHPYYGGSVMSTAFAVADRLRNWASDHGRSLADLAIAWTLGHPAVTSSIVGAKTPEQARMNAAAGDWELDQNDMSEIDR